jgi:hypothetical protein
MRRHIKKTMNPNISQKVNLSLSLLKNFNKFSL